MMQTLLELLDGLPARDRLKAWWNAPIGSLDAHGLPSSALPVCAAWLARLARRPLLALVPDPEGSFQEAGAWFRDDVRPVVFPAVEPLPFDRLAPDEETVRRRLEAIDALGAGEPVVCFTSWTAMTRPTLAQQSLRRWGFTLEPGQSYTVDDLVRRLTTLGYRREALVPGRGGVSLRGGILDCFPPPPRRPPPREFFCGGVQALRGFQGGTQGSVGDIANARILPAAEIMLTREAVAGADGPLREIDFSRTLPEVRDQWLTDIERVRSGAYFDGIEGFQAYLDPSQPTLFDHLPQDALILSLDGRRSLTQAEQREQELQELVAVEIERGELPHGLRPGLVSIASLRQAAGGWRRLRGAPGAGPGALGPPFQAAGGHARRA